MNLEDLILTGKTPSAKKLVVYGVAGIGKTTFAASANALIQPTEEGYQNIECKRFPLAKSFGEVLTNLSLLIKNGGGGFPAYALDSLDWLESLIHKQIADEHGCDKEGIEKIPYGKGYKLALVQWRRFLSGCDKLRELGVDILFLAHEKIKRFDSPLTDSYDRYQLKLHDSACELIKEWADALLFANYKVFTTSEKVGFGGEKTRGLGSGERILHTSETPAFVAKNRFGLTAELPFLWEALKKSIGE